MGVLSVVKVRIEPDKADVIVAEAAETLRSASAVQPGFLAGEILVGHDRKTVVLISEWTDLHTWSQSRYDVRVGKTLEHYLAASSEIEFEIYDRYLRLSALPESPSGAGPS
jgi:quinol monooxygenase YgiN